MHAGDLAGTARDHSQFGVKSFQVKLTHHTAMSLFDQKHARTGFKLILDEFEFSFGHPEPQRVLLEIRVSVRKEHLGRRLLDQGAADGTVEHVARALRRKAHYTVEFAPSL